MNLNKTIIPSVRDFKYFDRALESQSDWVLLSESDIGNLQSFVAKCHNRNKKVLVHLELLGGFKSDSTGIAILKKLYQVDGVISSNFNALHQARKQGLITIYRVLLIDSRALDNSIEFVTNNSIDAIELLPAEYACICYDRLTRKIDPRKTHFIAGGFVNRKYIAEKVFYTGFDGLTTSEPSLW